MLRLAEKKIGKKRRRCKAKAYEKSMGRRGEKNQGKKRAW